MKIKIIEIGNSHEKPALSSNENPRNGWDKAFKEMAKAEDDTLLDKEDFTLSSDKKGWKW